VHDAAGRDLCGVQFLSNARRLWLFAGIDIGSDDDDVLVAVFLQPQFLSLTPCRQIICQHEIPMLDDVEHTLCVPKTLSELMT
jgi:hypothetical protein